MRKEPQIVPFDFKPAKPPLPAVGRDICRSEAGSCNLSNEAPIDRKTRRITFPLAPRSAIDDRKFKVKQRKD
jgi:hypothetical protein